MKEIVSKCTHGIDLHTAAIYRNNLPQIRASIDDEETKRLAHCFGTTVIINSKLRDGSLREAARKKKVTLLLYEGGEALRLEENSIKMGLRGCLSVMREIAMLPKPVKALNKRITKQTFVAQNSYWVRAPHSGSFYAAKKVGDHVGPDERLALITDPFGERPYEVKSRDKGIIIGISKVPLINEGDAMIHIATFDELAKVKNAINILDTDLY